MSERHKNDGARVKIHPRSPASTADIPLRFVAENSR